MLGHHVLVVGGRVGQADVSCPGHHVLVVGEPPQVFGSPWFAILVLVAAVLAGYANSLRCPFVFDDYNDIIDNPSIRHLWPLGDVFLVRSESVAGLQSRPVVNLSFALDYAVGGLHTLPYHVHKPGDPYTCRIGLVRGCPPHALAAEAPRPLRPGLRCLGAGGGTAVGAYTLCKPSPSPISPSGTNR